MSMIGFAEPGEKSVIQPQTMADNPSRWPASVTQVSAFPNDHVGGSEYYAYQLASHLASRGHQVSIITSNLDRWKGKKERWGSIQVERCPAPFTLLRTNPLTWAIPALLRSNASIFHVHTHYFLASLQAAMVAKPRDKKLLLHIHGLDLGGAPSIPGLEYLTRLREELYDPIVTRWMVKRADAIASVSLRDLALLEERYGAPPDRLYWIPNAVDTAPFRSHVRHQRDPPVLLYVGRLEATKGADLLPSIVSGLDAEGLDFRLEVAGDGSLRSRIEASLRQYDGRVRFHGSVPHSRIPELLSRAYVLLLPSRIEGVPTVCLEALAAGVPIVAANIGGTHEIVRDGLTGFLCTPGDVKGFVDRLRYLIENPTVASRLGREGPHIVERDYTWSAVVPRVERAYAALTM